jgi:hypothetical protein
MENRIKTALEKAMERAQNLEVSETELQQMDLVPKGQTLAAKFLQDKDLDLRQELAGFREAERHLVLKGLEETLLRNINPPATEGAAETNRRAMEGILTIKEDKRAVMEVFGELEYLFQYYTEAVKHTYANLKEVFSRRTDAAKQVLEQQMGIRVRVDVEKHPAFQEEWLRALNDLNARYEGILAEHKERIRRIR